MSYFNDRKIKSALDRLKHPLLFEIYESINRYGIEGISGTRYMCFAWRGETAYLRASEAARPFSQIRDTLAEFGVSLCAKEGDAFLAKVIPTISDFRSGDALDHPGRTDLCFAFPSGEVRSANKPDAFVAFPLRPEIDRLAGNTDDWKSGVGVRLLGNSVPQFTASLPIAAALADCLGKSEPMIVEIVGDMWTGTDHLPAIAASVSGSVLSSIPFKSLVDDSEKILPACRGSLLSIGDVGFAVGAESPARRQSQILNAVQAVLACKNGPKVCLITGRQPLAEWVGRDSDVARILRERIITIEVGADRPFGVCDAPGDKGVAAYFADLEKRITQAHGGPIRTFVDRLMVDLAADESQIHTRTERRIARFVEQCHLDPSDLVANKKAMDIGWIYAAARFGDDYGIWPTGWVCGKSSIRCYRLQHLVRPVLKSIRDVLLSIADAPDTLRLDSEIAPSRDQILAARALLRGSGDNRKLFVRPSALAHFRELQSRIREAATKELLISPDPISSKQRLGCVGLQRVLAFRLPEKA